MAYNNFLVYGLLLFCENLNQYQIDNDRLNYNLSEIEKRKTITELMYPIWDLLKLVPGLSNFRHQPYRKNGGSRL